MSIFGTIMNAIFGSKASAAPAGGAASGGAAPAGAPAQTVDVAPILDKAVAAKKEKLEWRTSIVDLMKALDIDSISFLNLIIALKARLGIDVPELDYPKLRTLRGALDYLEARSRAPR